MFLPLALFGLLLPLLANADDAQLRLLHRIYGPGVPELPFSLRATLDQSTLQLTPAPHLQDTLAQFYNDVKGNKDALYQIAFQALPDDTRPDVAADRLDISSVKAVCLFFLAIFIQGHSLYCSAISQLQLRTTLLYI